jgi:general secretion pathway protein K
MTMNPKRQCGFVLVVTLWMLAIITIGAASFAEQVAISINLARQSQQATDALVDFASTRAEILFRLSTARVNGFGLGATPTEAITLDNRLYRGTGQDMVRLQDSRGLININFIQPDMLRRLLGQMSIPSEIRETLLDTLNDYTDTDDLRRLNGAEAAEYLSRDLPPPPNDWLITPWQLQNIIGWREQTALWRERRLPELLTTARVVGFNPNTAPREALAALPGSSPKIADRMIELRKVKLFTDVAELSKLTGQGGFDSESILFFPGNNFRLMQESDKIPWALHYQITLTPLNDFSPWRIDYYLKIGVTPTAQNANHPQLTAIPLPQRATLAATADPTL